MQNRRLRWIAIPLAAVAAAEIGHFLSYGARFGPGAMAVQTGGAHSYLPALSALLSGSAGLLVLLALLVIGLARRSGHRVTSGGISLVNLASLLLILQVTIYGLQEVAETAAAGLALPSLAEIAFWGLLGQLPVAVITAAILGRLLAGVEDAIEVLASSAFARLKPRRLPNASSPPAAHVAPIRQIRRWGAAGLRGPPFPV